MNASVQESVKVARWQELRAYHRTTMMMLGAQGALGDWVFGVGVFTTDSKPNMTNAVKLSERIDSYGPNGPNWESKAWDSTMRVMADESAYQRGVDDQPSLSRVWREVVVQSGSDLKAGVKEVAKTAGEVASRAADLLPWVVVGFVAYVALRFR